MGRTTDLAIKNLMKGIPPTKSGINHINSCGSLAISRLLPYSLLSAVTGYKDKLQNSDVRRILGVTHAHKKVYDMGRLVNYFVQEITHDRSPKETLNVLLFEDEFLSKRIRKKLQNVKNLSESRKKYDQVINEIGNSGFVEDVVFSAIYCTIRGKSFKEAVLISANGKGDSDSRAALTGALYGLDIGKSQIPTNLKNQLERSSELSNKAGMIYNLRE